MGAIYHYHCPRCGYHTLSVGGRSQGRIIILQTYYCFSCRAMVDFAITPGAPVLCPCGGTLLLAWNATDGCPRCRKPLRRRLSELFD